MQFSSLTLLAAVFITGSHASPSASTTAVSSVGSSVSPIDLTNCPDVCYDNIPKCPDGSFAFNQSTTDEPCWSCCTHVDN